THEFIVCCQNMSLKQRLQVFIGKTIFENGKYLYWFVGERIIEQDNSSVHGEKRIEEAKIENLKTDTRLPDYIDDFIFNKLNAIYTPGDKRFEYTVDLNAEELRTYLRTFNPRSYAETFFIFDYLFQKVGYQQASADSKALNI